MFAPHLADLPDITVWGWTPTDEQTTAAGAVIIGIILAVGLIAASRRLGRLFIVFLVAVGAAALWWSASKYGLLTILTDTFLH